MKNRRRLLAAPLILLLASLYVACGREAQAPAPPPKPRVAPAPPTASQAQTTEETGRGRALTASGRLLAGLPVEGPGPWAAIQKRPAWRAHAKALGSLWVQHERMRLSKVRAWGDAHLAALDGKDATVFYPFGGPDALYPTALFPNDAAFVLVGLEPVGEAPDLAALSPTALDESLKEMELYITPILQISFFRTDDMEVELADKGTLPILVTFLAGTGHAILDVEPLALGATGAMAPFAGEGKPHAARITFAREGGPPQTLTYISQDLSDAGLRKSPAFAAYLDAMGRHATFLKAASYLMHRPTFSTIRTAILDRSEAVLQDDSGIPLKDFAPDRWSLSFFGTYTAPIKRFAVFSQKGLVEAYHGSGSVAPLDFGIGYRHHAGESNLMLAVRRR